MDFQAISQRLDLFLIVLMILSSHPCLAASSDYKFENYASPIEGSIKTSGHARTEYPSLARLSCIEAIKKASGFISGKVTECKLEDEDGYLVYGVEIVTKDNIVIEVQVDAGNGKILSSEEDPPEKDILKKFFD